MKQIRQRILTVNEYPTLAIFIFRMPVWAARVRETQPAKQDLVTKDIYAFALKVTMEIDVNWVGEEPIQYAPFCNRYAFCRKSQVYGQLKCL